MMTAGDLTPDGFGPQENQGAIVDLPPRCEHLPPLERAVLASRSIAPCEG